MSPAAGRVFGPYRLLRSIAADAVSTTYAAIADDGNPTHDGAPRLLVRIAGPIDQGDDDTTDLVRRFLAHSQRAGAIDHPSVIRTHDLGVIEGRPYVATPYVRAVPLGDMLTHGGAINDAAAIAIFAQLAGALDAGHRTDVVHGSLSPRTIWVGPSAGGGSPYVGYLTGFGTSLLLQAHLGDATTDPPVDDILYVAPEQLRGEPATPASDQYSLACALYHTLVGHPPFERDSRAKLYGAHLLAPAPEPTSGEVSAETTAAALHRGMSKRPADRFDTCGLLINAALPEAMVPAGRRDAVHSAPAAVGGARRRWAPMLVAAALVLVGVVLWLLFRPTADAPLTASGSEPTRVVASAPHTSGSSAPNVAPRWSTAAAGAPVASLEVVDGLVVAATNDGTLAGVRPAAGRVRWRTSVDEVRELAVGRAAVVSTADALTALDLDDGAPRWRVEEALWSMQVTDEAVVGAYQTAADAGVRGLGLADGRQLWSTSVPSGADAAGAPLTVQTEDDTLVYALSDGVLLAIDQSQVLAAEAGRDELTAPVWQVDVDDVWPVLAPTAPGVAIAGRDGQICFHAGRTGAVMWCEAVPGSDVEQPSLSWTRRGLIASTSRAIVALDPASGVPLWSVSPGSPRNLTAASNAFVVIAADDGASLLDAATGDAVLSVSGTGHVTALAAHERWVLIGTADGLVHRFDPAPAG